MDEMLFKAYDMLGMCYYNIGNYDKAIECLNRYLQSNSRSYKISNTLGAIYSYLKNYDKAIEYFNKAIEINPKYANAYNNLALIFFKQKNFDKAALYFDKARKFDLDSFTDYYKLAISYYSKKYYYEAIEYFKKVIERNSNSYKAYNFIGLCYLSNEEYDKSIEYFKKAIEINDMYYKAYNNLANAYLNLKDYDEAIKYFKSSIDINDSNEAYYGIAICYYSKGEKETSAYYLNKNIDNINENYIDMLFNIYIDLEDYDKAIVCVRKNNKYYDKLINILYDKKEYSKIITLFEENNNNLVNNEIIANSYFYTKNYDKAIEYYEKLLETNKDNFIYYNNIAILFFLKNDYPSIVETYLKYLENNSLASYSIFLLSYSLLANKKISYNDFLKLADKCLEKSITYTNYTKTIYQTFKYDTNTLKTIFENRIQFEDINTILKDNFTENHLRALKPILEKTDIISFYKNIDDINNWNTDTVCVEYELLDSNICIINDNNNIDVYGKKAKFLSSNEDIEYGNLLSIFYKDRDKIISYKKELQLKVKAVYLSYSFDDSDINLMKCILKNENIKLYKMNNDNSYNEI